MNPVALLLGGGWRYLAAAALLIGGYAWLTGAAFDRGVAHERAASDKVVERAANAAVALAETRRQASAAADLARVERARLYALLRAPIANEVIRYVQTPAARAACPDLRGVQLGQAAIDAANAATGAAR